MRTKILFLLWFSVVQFLGWPLARGYSTSKGTSLGQRASRARSPSQAVKKSSKAQATHIHRNDKQIRLAFQYFEEKNFLASEAVLLKLVDIEPHKALLWFNLGHARLKLSKFSEAQEDYQKVIDLKSPLSEFAQVYQIMAFYEAGALGGAIQRLASIEPGLKSAAARSLAKQLRDEIENKQLEYLDRAQSLYLEKKYVHSLLELDRSEVRTADAQMLRGMILLKMKNIKEARSAFQSVAANHPDASQAESARVLVSQIEEGLWSESPQAWVSLAMAFGFNSNIYENGFSESPISSGASHFWFGGGIERHLSQQVSLQPSYQLLFEDAWSYDSADLLSHTIQVGAQWRKDMLSVRLAPQYQIQTLGHLPFLSRPGLVSRLSYSRNRTTLSLAHEFTKNVNDTAAYGYLDGAIQTTRLGYSTYRNKIQYAAGISYSNEDIKSLVYSDGTLPLGGAMFSVNGSLETVFAEKYEVNLTMNYSVKNFSERTTPDQRERVDNQTLVSLRLTQNLKQDINLFWSTTAVFNRSTLAAGSVADKNFEKYVSLVGAAWDALP